jgi:anaerobic selenocysteine-containing dehydrogenase
LKSEIAIVCLLAKATFQEKTNIKWNELYQNYDTIRVLIEKVISGFDNFNEKVRQPEGFYLPNPPREQRFDTSDGKALFTINEVPTWNLQAGEYMMMTIRSHDQFNTTIYGLNDRYRGVYNERRVILMNQKDMEKEGLKTRDVVDLTSEFKGVLREARQFLIVPYDIPQGNVATYFPEANTLIPIDSVADKSHTPTSKSVVVKIVRPSSSLGAKNAI